MAQIAIPLVVLGSLYLMSNDKEEGFVSIQESVDINDPSQLVRNQTDKVRNKYATSKHTMNNEGTYSQYQDKYFSPDSTSKDPLFKNVEDAKFISLSGNAMSNNEVSHNNMTVFYGSKSYGSLPGNDFKNANLDNFVGAGSLSIEKKEIGSMFSPESNVQNVYGNQNQSDFFQSRVNESMRKANTLPWEQVRDNKGEAGFNWAMVDRDKSMPKKVDDLRVANNPKSQYELNYKAPAYDPKVAPPTVEQLGRIVKKGPDTYHVNNGMEMMGAAGGMERPRIAPDQMLTNEERDTTNVEYYGARGVDDIGYVNRGEEGYVHKQSLKTDTVLNFKNSELKPNSSMNYGKDGYKSYVNNRDNDTDYFGAFQGAFFSNIINPLVKTLKHTKKKDVDAPLTNFKGNTQAMVFNPREHMPVTNREMNTEKIGMNHLTVERQDGSGYKIANPYLPGTHRPTTNVEIYGQANGGDKQRSYGAEYNQRNIQKPFENRVPNGNSKEYQTDMNYQTVNKERPQNYTNYSVRPSAPGVQFMGEQTKNVISYENINESYNHSDLLKAFKSNPYTQPLGSFA